MLTWQSDIVTSFMTEQLAKTSFVHSDVAFACPVSLVPAYTKPCVYTVLDAAYS